MAWSVEGMLQRARKVGEEVYKKAREIVEKETPRDSLTLNSFEKEVEVNGKRHIVRVLFWDVKIGRLLKINITAEVDGVARTYTITFRRFRG